MAKRKPLFPGKKHLTSLDKAEMRLQKFIDKGNDLASDYNIDYDIVDEILYKNGGKVFDGKESITEALKRVKKKFVAEVKKQKKYCVRCSKKVEDSGNGKYYCERCDRTYDDYIN